jgi:hypothetical protein
VSYVTLSGEPLPHGVYDDLCSVRSSGRVPLGPQALQSTSVEHYALFVDSHAQLEDLLTFFVELPVVSEETNTRFIPHRDVRAVVHVMQPLCRRRLADALFVDNRWRKWACACSFISTRRSQGAPLDTRPEV